MLAALHLKLLPIVDPVTILPGDEIARVVGKLKTYGLRVEQ